MLIHLPFPPLVIISMLHLLKQGTKRRGKKLLGPRAVAAVSGIKGVLAAAAALPDIGNARPSDGDGVGARGERGTSVSIGAKRERERSYCGLKDKRKNKRAP